MCSFDSCSNLRFKRQRGLPWVRAGVAFSLGLTGLAPATTFSSSVFAKTIRHSTPAFLRAASYNRSRSTPRARSRFRDDNCDVNARLSPTRDQNTFPNKDALPPMADHKNKFRPNVLRPWHSPAPSACRTRIRRPRLTRDRGCDPRLLWPTRLRSRISPGLSPNNALQNLHVARPPVIRSSVEESLAT